MNDFYDLDGRKILNPVNKDVRSELKRRSFTTLKQQGHLSRKIVKGRRMNEDRWKKIVGGDVEE